MKDIARNFVKQLSRALHTRLKTKHHPYSKQSQSNQTPNTQIGPVYIFIRSWNRPLYLWACLDSLYRNTDYPCRFVLIDNQSNDPLVHQIIDGFQRRQLFHQVHLMDQNHAANQTMTYFRYKAKLGKYFLVLDADITVEKTVPCWLTQLINLAEKYPNFAAIGSYLDTSDFIDPQLARTVAPELSERQVKNLIKANSPERGIPEATAEIITPFTPPGRLLLLRTAIINQVGLRVGNVKLCNAIQEAGYQVGIASNVRHRHLSLLNFFDYPDYDFKQLKSYLSGQ